MLVMCSGTPDDQILMDIMAILPCGTSFGIICLPYILHWLTAVLWLCWASVVFLHGLCGTTFVWDQPTNSANSAVVPHIPPCNGHLSEAQATDNHMSAGHGACLVERCVLHKDKGRKADSTARARTTIANADPHRTRPWLPSTTQMLHGHMHVWLQPLHADTAHMSSMVY